MEIDIDRLATLAKLNLTVDEKNSLSHELPKILDYINKLQAFDTNNVDPKFYLTEAVNVLRDDVPFMKSEERDLVVAAFPVRMGEALEVPGVFTE